MTTRYDTTLSLAQVAALRAVLGDYFGHSDEFVSEVIERVEDWEG